MDNFLNTLERVEKLFCEPTNIVNASAIRLSFVKEMCCQLKVSASAKGQHKLA
jgi:hypothetical protein